MSVTNAYQQVIAGRVREDEQISFFGENKIAALARVTAIRSTGNLTPDPAIVRDHLQDTGVGKAVSERDANYDVGQDNSYNVAG